jgi:hypothetical protein
VAKQTFKGLLRDTIEAVRASTVPVRAVEYDPSTKRLRVEFASEPAAAPVAIPLQATPDAVHPETKFIPGTEIPDDDTPVDAMAIAMAHPRYSLNGEAGS